MADLDTYDHLPIQIDPQSKAILAPTSNSRALANELRQLNALHRALLTLEPPNTLVPPPPVPVNPKRTAQITKLRESGNAEFRRGKPDEAVRFYSMGLNLAVARPPWEPSQLAREEAAALFANRAQGFMAMGAWPEGAGDAEMSVEAKRAPNSKAWWRRGKCLMEMGRLEEAREWVRKGLEMESEEGELGTLLREIVAKITKGEGVKA